MFYSFTLMNREDAQAVLSWHYEEPYTTYNHSGDLESDNELLDRRSPYYAVRNELSELVGFFCFGTAATVEGHGEPRLYAEDKTLSLGLGLRPDLTGKGYGLDFVRTGLTFAQQEFAPHAIQLFVLSWNKRAIRVYERVGFQQIRVFVTHNIHGTNEFVEMRLITT